MRFEWDQSKAASNLTRHGVSFIEATSVFADPLAEIFGDDDHAADERREIIIGHSEQWRLLLISYTERGGAVRIVSARKVTRHERKDYEEDVTT
jgi:hypothetical protein